MIVAEKNMIYSVVLLRSFCFNGSPQKYKEYNVNDNRIKLTFSYKTDEIILCLLWNFKRDI